MAPTRRTRCWSTAAALLAAGASIPCAYASSAVSPSVQPVAEIKSVAGAGHFMSLRADGSILARGSNGFGQLGDGTTLDRTHLSPLPLPFPAAVAASAGAVGSEAARIVDVALGAHHSLFLAADGEVYAAGRNDFGQVGDECFCTQMMPECQECERERLPQATPVRVKFPELLQADVRQVSAGDCHSVFLRNDGTVYASGWNTRGQLGDGTVTSRRSPVFIMANISAVAAGAAYTLLLRGDGDLYATGANSLGQLGNGLREDLRTPQLVRRGVERVQVGVTHSIFYMRDGTAHITGGVKG
eukprot:TRINITY_DN56164_c0_g1_i1.p1 TRINITY_DN56164_c0_g1~~TRINITY_DN56164_c0_g1_i1.p1  ORF type:complete len:335 (+),score=69.44 TRINITY_DN56164_c0_g1_i1:107-1006(+)